MTLHGGTVRQLPFQVRPRAGEGFRSFASRLAQANHLPFPLLMSFLRQCPGREVLPWTPLAAVTGRDPDLLRQLLETVNCRKCGTPMPPTGALGRRAVYCSARCLRLVRMARVPLAAQRQQPCWTCGTPTNVRPGQRRILCSSDCRRTAGLERRRDDGQPRQRRKR